MVSMIWSNLCILISPEMVSFFLKGVLFQARLVAPMMWIAPWPCRVCSVMSRHEMPRKFYPSEDLKQPGFVSNADHNPMRSMRWYFAVVTCYKDWRIGWWWSLQSANDLSEHCWRLVLMTIHDVMKLDILRPTVGCGECTAQRVEEAYEPLLIPIWSKFYARSFHFPLFHPGWILVMFSTLDVFCLYIHYRAKCRHRLVGLKVLAVTPILHLHNQHWWILQCNR